MIRKHSKACPSRNPRIWKPFAVSLAVFIALLALFAGAGCKKSGTDAKVVPTFDVPKLHQTFEGASPDVLQSVDAAQMDYRYHKYDAALADLDKLAADTSLTDPQKQMVTQLTDQVKQAKASSPAQ